MSLAEEITMLRKRVKEQDKEIRRLKEETNSWRKPVLFSPPAVGSRQKPENDLSGPEDRRRQDYRENLVLLQNAWGQPPSFYKYLANKDRPWKYQDLADAMKEIVSEDECNDTYGRIRMYQALLLKQPEGVHIPSERTVYRVMDQIGLSHRPKRKPNGITKADREAMKSDDLLKRDFRSDTPLEKCITDITEIPASNGKLYVSAIFDCLILVSSVWQWKQI